MAATGGTGSMRQSSLSTTPDTSASAIAFSSAADDDNPPRLTSCVVDALRSNPLNLGSFRRLLFASEGATDSAPRLRRESAALSHRKGAILKRLTENFLSSVVSRCSKK